MLIVGFIPVWFFVVGRIDDFMFFSISSRLLMLPVIVIGLAN